jgi:hypothetical protein
MLRRLTSRLRRRPRPPKPLGEHLALPTTRDFLFADLDSTMALRVFGLGPRPAPIVDLATAVSRRDVPAARIALADVLIRHPETRLWLQAWALAREAGLPPSDSARRVRGVIVEMGLELGVDTVAGYDDGSARYLNQAGGGVFWNGRSTPDLAIVAGVDALLAAGQAAVDAHVPLAAVRLGPPPHGAAMIAILTEGGIHFGAGPADVLSRDPYGGPAIAAAIKLMVALIDTSQKRGLKDGATVGANVD